MALVKRGRYWHYDFWYNKTRHQGSTDQTNINKAKLVEAKIRSDAALEAFGIVPPKDSPNFKEFMTGRFLEHVRQHNAKKPRTVQFYAESTARLVDYAPFARLRLSNIDKDLVDAYALHRGKSVAVATLNGELRTLRKALILANDWKLAPRIKVKTVPGENQREFVLTGELENRYLALADYPLKQAAILMLDLGLRPTECVSLRKADVFVHGVNVRQGKTANATRSLPQTERTRKVLEFCSAVHPDSEWVFPGRKGNHLSRKSLDNLHTRIRREHDLPAEFVLYSLRHTFGTRLAEVASPFDVKSAMGHSSVTVTEKYVHPTGDHLRVAMRQKEALDRTLRGESEPQSLQNSRQRTETH